MPVSSETVPTWPASFSIERDWELISFWPQVQVGLAVGRPVWWRGRQEHRERPAVVAEEQRPEL